MSLAALRRLASGAVAVERAWLSWSMPPPGLAIAESGWVQEGPGACCRFCGASIPGGRSVPDPGGPCPECRGESLPWQRLVRLGAFEADLADWVRAIKYRRWEPMGVELGRRLGTSIAEVLPAGASPVVVPMPMPLIRRLQRGIDHTDTVASAVASALGCRVRRLLAHAGGPPQVTLPAAQRRKRSSPFRLRRLAGRAGLAGRTVVLVDDVRTTGATMRAAARIVQALEPAGVIAGVLAVADAPEDHPG